ncbi:hypothetical protein VTO73DRAFT_5001 [Trametes versicolor]
MDGFDNITAIPGSRHPIVIPDSRLDASSSSSHTPTPPSTDSSNLSLPTLRSRRKPARTFKSPSANEPAGWEGIIVPHKRGTPPYEKPPSRQSTSESARSSPPISIPARRAAAQRKVPLLPLYHPLGPLAQSLPELDPGYFGLPGSLNIEDPDDQREGDPARRSTSRTQRPGQKTREREMGDDDAQTNGTPNGTGKPGAEAATKNPSPRKRRGGGAKRKRKDADDGDPAFPAPPAKRTRNPRGANLNVPVAPSPLISEAVVASDLVEDAVEGGGEPDAPPEEAPPAPKRSARTRKPRAKPAKRRDSSGSASTTTSVSVTITATAKSAAQSQLEGEPAVEVAPEAKPEPAAAPQEDTPTPAQAEELIVPQKEVGKKVEELPPSPSEPPHDETPAIVAPAVIPKREEPPPKASAPADPPAPPPPPPPRHISPPPMPAPVPVPPPQKEEREEGELSDDA